MERAERREEIKLLIEYIKIILSLLGIGSLIFTGLQWRDSNKAADQAVYQRMTSEWRDHLKIFIDKSHLRPYFEGKKLLENEDSRRDEVLALADVRLDVMDAILTFANPRFSWSTIEGWRKTFEGSFRESPILCIRWSETQSYYGLLNSVGRSVCQPRGDGRR
jgi:hypothetical protein